MKKSISLFGTIGAMLMLGVNLSCEDIDSNPNISNSNNLEIKKGISSEEIEYGSFVDERDGKKYKTAKINGTNWMAENLAFLDFGNITGWGFPRIPLRHEATYSAHMLLRDFYTPTSAKFACPKGWRLPSNQEFSDMIKSTNNNYKGLFGQLDFAGKCYNEFADNSLKMNFYPTVMIPNKKCVYGTNFPFVRYPTNNGGVQLSTPNYSLNRNGKFLNKGKLKSYGIEEFLGSNKICIRCIEDDKFRNEEIYEYKGLLTRLAYRENGKNVIRFSKFKDGSYGKTFYLEGNAVSLINLVNLDRYEKIKAVFNKGARTNVDMMNNSFRNQEFVIKWVVSVSDEGEPFPKIVQLLQNGKDVSTPVISEENREDYLIQATFEYTEFGDDYHLVFKDASGKEWDFGLGENNYEDYEFGEETSNPELVGKKFLIEWKSSKTKSYDASGENVVELEALSIVNIQLLE